MTPRPSGELAGTVRWAVAPYAPRPPFRIYATGRDPYTIGDSEQLIDASRRGGDPELTYLVPAKARPLLILNNPPGPTEWQEVTALRLLRLSKLADPERQNRVRRREERLLYYLEPGRFELPEENAAIVPALVTIHVDALGAAPPLGTLEDDEMRELGERVIEYYGFDTRRLVERTIQRLAARQRSRRR